MSHKIRSADAEAQKSRWSQSAFRVHGQLEKQGQRRQPRHQKQGEVETADLRRILSGWAETEKDFYGGHLKSRHQEGTGLAERYEGERRD